MDNKRLKLGILFNFSPQWMGGIIYVINLVKTLNLLKDEEKPEITLFYQPGLSKFLDEFKYPYLTIVEWQFPSVVRGNIKSWLLRKNVFYDPLIKAYSLDAVYPAKNYPVKSRTGARVVAWYADLQHKYYPEFFSKTIILHRNIRLYYMLRNADDLVVSSQAVKDDFSKFFKLRKGLKFHVFHFTSINDDYRDVDFQDLKQKYRVPDQYYMVSNQFHKHKNHKVLLLALARLKEKGIKKHLAITGKFPKASDSPYLAELHTIIEENELQDQISLLGIIPRNDQINLMKYSQAVLQPSLFEGWSTVIEDAISLQVPVIASDLPVNIEQLQETGTYFKPHDADQLAGILSAYPVRDMNKKPYEEYSLRIDESLKVLMDVFR
jgi:glycosyltransferase involved in cell wall biosynthesis